MLGFMHQSTCHPIAGCFGPCGSCHVNRRHVTHTAAMVLAALVLGILWPTGAQSQQFSGFAWPLDCAWYTGTSADYQSTFATLFRDTENGNFSYTEGMGSHPGVDIDRLTNPTRSAEGAAVRCVYDGIVAQVLYDTARKVGWGNCLIVKHPSLPGIGVIYSCYAHLNRFARKYSPGVTVSKGETIGYVGNTGNSRGPHLHFQIDIDRGGTHPYWPVTNVNSPDIYGNVMWSCFNPLRLVQHYWPTGLPDGMAVKETHGNDIYEVCAGGLVHIPNMIEFNAMGFGTWTTVPDGSLRSVPRYSIDTAVVKERSNDACYVIHGGRRFHIRTKSAFDRFTGGVGVRIVPNGSLDDPLSTVPYAGDIW